MAMETLLPHHCLWYSPLTKSSLLPHASVMVLLCSEDVQEVLLWLLQQLWTRSIAMALSPSEKIRVSQGEAVSPSKLNM